MALDKNQIREWRAAYLAHNKAVLEENRVATLEERWYKIYQVEGTRESLGLERPPRDDAEIRDRWLRAKLRLHGR